MKISQITDLLNIIQKKKVEIVLKWYNSNSSK